MSIAAVILAGGASARLGEPKQLVELGGERLLERTVRLCREAGLSPVIVVLGARGAEIAAQCDLRDAEVVRCERWSEGMSQTLRAGIEAAAENERVVSAVVLTTDMPFITPSHLMALCRKRAEVRASAYGERNGVPAHFPRRFFPELMELHGDTGARDLLRAAKTVKLDEKDALDVDTPEDMAWARAVFAARKRLRRGAR